MVEKRWGRRNDIFEAGMPHEVGCNSGHTFLHSVNEIRLKRKWFCLGEDLQRDLGGDRYPDVTCSKRSRA